ncbi:microtubule-associated tumor suppressor 1 homolog A-like isoform X2 [Gouania willdenowi]|uniref:microtubule-associated tumor suppressor 1 homolog A-like isoform X2 n=1 Tax=Gouania willdenowi TaxID=441366 RepID=UPI0010569979|nr:microtubule-associated tumor suppressor 1 homolog A-like isoform X2 [Gouania willdenowi]
MMSALKLPGRGSEDVNGNAYSVSSSPMVDSSSVYVNAWNHDGYHGNSDHSSKVWPDFTADSDTREILEDDKDDSLFLSVCSDLNMKWAEPDAPPNEDLSESSHTSSSKEATPKKNAAQTAPRSTAAPIRAQTQKVSKPGPRGGRTRKVEAESPTPGGGSMGELPAANQQPASVSLWRKSGPTSSKLPVKGLPTILSGSSATRNNNNNNNNGDAIKREPSAKAPPIKSRALPLQTRATPTGQKASAVPAHSVVRTAHIPVSTAPLGVKTTPTLCPKQRSRSTVDKNKPREAATNKTTKTNNLRLPQQVSTSSSPSLTSHPKPGGVGLKSRTGSRPSPQTVPRPAESGRGQARLTQIREQEKKNQTVLQLKRLLLQNNRRTEALAAVLQYHLTQHEEALKQKKELLVQVSDLREELVSSSQSLQQDKDEALNTLQEQHQEELVQLEERLRSFYQSQWDEVQRAYREEAELYRHKVETQVEELRTNHSHTVETLTQQYDSAVHKMKDIHQTELENLQKNLKETETTLSAQLHTLSAKKEELSERLKVEEQKNFLMDKNLRDTHTVFLQQELESLKVVLEMKSSQLQQKEKRLMEMERVMETNVKLEENLKKVQQENELYRVRMDKQTQLSKQLCSEQAVLQQTLQKESKVNKRLSMENEELLWKLTNSDLISSPRRLSPSSPFGSPRNSASFPSAAPPLSPR